MYSYYNPFALIFTPKHQKSRSREGFPRFHIFPSSISGEPREAGYHVRMDNLDNWWLHMATLYIYILHNYIIHIHICIYIHIYCVYIYLAYIYILHIYIYLAYIYIYIAYIYRILYIYILNIIYIEYYIYNAYIYMAHCLVVPLPRWWWQM